MGNGLFDQFSIRKLQHQVAHLKNFILNFMLKEKFKCNVLFFFKEDAHLCGQKNSTYSVFHVDFILFRVEKPLKAHLDTKITKALHYK